MKRRDFLTTLWKGIGALAAAGAGVIGLRFLLSQNQQASSGRVVVAGLIDQFTPDTVTPFLNDKFYLVRHRDGGFLALYRQCTHLSCVVLWEEEQFRCPCHGSSFALNGEVLSPPAPQPLTCFAITFEGGQVRVDTGKQIHRRKTSLADFVYPPEAKT